VNILRTFCGLCADYDCATVPLGRVRDSSGATTIALNGQQGEVELGGEGVHGDLIVRDSSGVTTIALKAQPRRLDLFSEAGDRRAILQGDFGVLKLGNSSEEVTVELRGGEGRLTLGPDGNGTVDGEVIIKDNQGGTAINCHGTTGIIDCVDVFERPIPSSLARNIVPLMNALDRVLALRGVTCQRRAGDCVHGSERRCRSDRLRLPGVGTVCPKLVATDAEGHKSVSYSRMTAVLVEAIKEQQQQIREQAAWERLRQLPVAD
jgi:hypothetical protein